MISLVIGSGGTGAYAVEELVSILGATGKSHVVVVIDGDEVEERNLERQAFYPKDIERNKARAVVNRIETNDSQNVSVYAYEDFIYTWLEIIDITKRIWDLHEDQTELMIICGADNNAVRHRIDLATKVIHELDLFDDVITIDSGNEEYTGEVLVTHLKRGVDYLDNQLDYRLARINGDLEDRLTYGDFEMSCDLAAESDPQNIGTNMLAAYIILNGVIQYLTLGKVESKTFNARSGYVEDIEHVSQEEYIEMLENGEVKEKEQEEYRNNKKPVIRLAR